MSDYKSVFGLGIFRYSDKFLKILKMYFIILLFFSILYTIFGYNSSDWNGIKKENDNTLIEKFFNRFYFSSITFSTIGYGDISPNTPLLRVFTCCFALLIVSGIFSIYH